MYTSNIRLSTKIPAPNPNISQYIFLGKIQQNQWYFVNHEK